MMETNDKIIFDDIIMKKVYNPDEGDFVNALFLVTIEFDKQKYLNGQPCGCDYGQNKDAHEIIKMDSGLFLKCKAQKSTYGLLPTLEKGNPHTWVKVLKKKQISRNEARKLYASKKFVATPDIILYLAKGKAW